MKPKAFSASGLDDRRSVLRYTNGLSISVRIGLPELRRSERLFNQTDISARTYGNACVSDRHRLCRRTINFERMSRHAGVDDDKKR